MKDTQPETFYPTDQKKWRAWLQKNHAKKQSIWVIYNKIKSGKPTMTWSDAVDEALCFGWIDSTRKSLDDEKFMQLFSRRKPGSTWSKINKGKVEQLIAEGRMTTAGLKVIDIAKENGSWEILTDVEELKIPKDLEKAFKAHKGSNLFFSGLSKSVRKAMLQWLALAKRPETRQKRIDEIAKLAGEKRKPKQF